MSHWYVDLRSGIFGMAVGKLLVCGLRFGIYGLTVGELLVCGLRFWHMWNDLLCLGELLIQCPD